MRYDQYLAQGWASGTGVIEGTYGHYMYAIIRSSTAIISDATAFSTCKRTITVATWQVRTKRLSVEDGVEADAFGRAIIFSDPENAATQRHQRLLMLWWSDQRQRALAQDDPKIGEPGIVWAVVPGFSIRDELRILTENGYSPYEAIATAAVNAAQVIQVIAGSCDCGTIQVGNRADLILVAGNPLEDIVHIGEPLGVMAAGRWYPRETLERMIAIED